MTDEEFEQQNEYEDSLQERIKELETRIAELEDKDWYEGCIKQLEEQNDRLIKERDEKDKEIEMLNLMIKTLPNHDTEIEQHIRKQVCDEIRKAIDECSEWYEQGYFIDMTEEDLLKEIDKIEQKNIKGDK